MMTTPGLALFDTPIGRCGIAWGEHGILDVELPGRDDQATRARLRRACPRARPTEPPPEVEHAMLGIRAVLSGEPRDLSFVRLDMQALAEFDRQVYAAARSIP